MDLKDFMNSLADTPVPKQDAEYVELEKQYEEKFGHIVPREMLPPSIKIDDIKKAMIDCIESGNGDILKVLNVEINDKYFY